MSDLIQPPNPFQSFTQGFNVGQGINQNVLQNEQLQFQQQQAQQQQIAAQEQTDNLNNLYGIIQSGNATAQDYVNLATALPAEQGKSVRESFGLLTEDQQRTTLRETGQIFSAFKSGRPDIALSLMEDQKMAYLNSGDEQSAKLMGMYIDAAKEGEVGQKAAESFFGFTMAQIPGGTDVIDSAINLGKEARAQQSFPGELKQQALDAGLTEAQTNQAIANGRKISNESAKLFLELETLRKTGGIDSETIFNQEEKLRKEYVSRIKNYTEAKTTLSNIESSALAASGAGDVALVTGFMKMLDPGSVVRETEFATARDTAGTWGMLQTILPKVKEGILLTPSQRKNFVGLAKQYMTSADKHEAKVRTDLSSVVDNYNLNPENIFGTTIIEETGQPKVIRGL